MSDGQIVRDLKPSDAGEIVELLDRVLKWPAFEIDTPKTDFWKWKYLDVPCGPAIAGSVTDQTGFLCHSGGLPKKIVIGSKEYPCTAGVQLIELRWTDLGPSRSAGDVLHHVDRSPYIVP